MINFDVKKTGMYGVLKLENFSLSKILGFFRILFFLLFLLTLLLFTYGFIGGTTSKESSKDLLGFSLIFLVIFIGAWMKMSFFNKKLKNPKVKINIQEVVLNPSNYNLADVLDFETLKVVNMAMNQGPSSTHILYYLLKENRRNGFIFSRLLLNINKLKKEVKSRLEKITELDKDNFEKTIIESLKIAVKNNHQRVQVGDILSALGRTDSVLEDVLLMKKLKKEDLDNLVLWFDNTIEKRRKRKRFWDADNLARKGTLAKEWTAGYTLTLDRYGRDITNSIKEKDLDFIGHEKEIERMERVLSRGEINNVLLVGEEGTGKKSMIYALAQKSLLGKSLSGASYKRIVELDIPSMLAQLESQDEVERVLDDIFREVALSGNIILVIDNIYNYVSQEIRPGVVDISGIISSYLKMPEFQVIGISNYEGLHRYIEKNPALLGLFTKVEVSGIELEKTLILLEYLTFNLENKYRIFISYPAIREVIDLSDKYFPSLPFPEKAIDILDEVAVYVSSLKEKIMLPEHVARVISEKSEVPVGEIEEKEKEILLNLENLIHQRIINQVEAVKEASTALRRARSEVTVRKGPMGAFLFLGPTGVGKTETCKALAHFYFGSEKKIIRLDMSEFQNINDIKRLIGSENERGLLTVPVKESPFSMVLLDELEKADHNILNLFLQVLDEGSITDGMGRKISFKNTIIIATSNAGYEIILKALKDKEDWEGVKPKILDYIFEKRIFRPEFINRFDATVVFKPLSKENLLDISQLMLSSLKKNLAEKGINFIITEDLKEKISELGYNPVFGARQMRRVIQDKVENILASSLLSGEIKRGDKVSINSETFILNINK
ncbi:ATP-dependent Clp protease ATP-binding subunit [Patescibacteria group bacterium]|nr:ATP-dependent Clp protease ATP-binding subunit [Patescibacteria group bacterium]